MSRPAAPRRRRDDVLIAAVLAALAVVLALGGGSWRADRLLYDTALALAPRATPQDIVIVAIDDASIEAIGRWPWARTVHATLLDRLAAARPRAIALDLLLSEPADDAQHDLWLAQALARAAPVVAPVAWQSLSGAPLAALEPTAALRAHVRLGAAEPAVDGDGVLRHMFLYAGPAAAPYPHLALALLQAGGESLHASLRPEAAPASAAQGSWVRDGRLLLRFAGPPGTMRQLSYVDVLRGAVPASALQGRYVLVGVTAQGLGDTLATPVNAGHQAMSGVEVLAQSLHMLRRGPALHPLPPLALAAGSALLLALLVFALRRLGARRGLPLSLLSIPAVMLLSGVSLLAGWAWSPLPYALPALLAYPMWSWRRLEHTVTVLDQEIRVLAAEPGVDGGASPPQASAHSDPLAQRLGELRRAGAVVRDARAFLAGTLEGLPTPMLVGGAGDEVALANTGAARLFDVEVPADLTGLDLKRLVAEFSPPPGLDWGPALAALQPGASGLSVEAALHGTDHLVHVAAIELLGSRRLIVSVADLAPIREAQRQREETLAFVSHDLRGPANAMLMLTTMHQHGDASLSPTALMDELQRLAARTVALSEDFVQAARAQTRPLQLASVSLQTLVDDGVADLRALAAQSGVALQLDVPVAAALHVDRDLLVRAIANLVSNAVKYSARGSTVCVRVRADGLGAALEVSDAGPGLAADQAAALARGDDQGLRVAGPGGVGLGLLFVQRVARRHGGRLVQRPGRPHTLVLELPSGNP